MALAGATFGGAVNAGYLPTVYNALHNGGAVGRGGTGYPKQANYVPDYQALINSDPGFMAIKQGISAQGIADAAQRKAATNQALIQFGAVPDFANAASQLGLSPQALAMLQGDIDPNTANLAQGNQFSTEANLKNQEDQAMLALRNNLAARGAISSGDNAYRTTQQDHAYQGAQQNALMQLLSAITGQQGTYAAQQQTEQGQLAQAIQQAETTQAGLPQNQGFSLNYNAHTGKYVGPTGQSFTPTRKGNGWVLADDQTGLSYILNPDGSLSLSS